MMHWTSQYSPPGPGPTLPLAGQGPLPHGHGISLDRDPLLVTSGGHNWRSVQACSLKDPPSHTLMASSGY